MKKLLAFLLAGMMAFSATACGSGNDSNTPEASQPTNSTEGTQDGETTPEGGIKIRMVTDTGGVNDQSFNQSAWEGLQTLKDEMGADVNYIESKQEADYATNLDKAADDEAQLIWGVGFAMADAIGIAATANPDIQYAIIDNGYDEATMPDKTGKVGFVGGVTSDIIDQFQYGFQAGVDYASEELGKTITVDVQYAESFTDASKGKAIASKMFSDGCDIVFHAAGGAGVGVIEAAKDAGKYAIGVDRDQAYLAPENVLTSAMKLVNNAVIAVSKEVIEGKEIGGQTYTYGLTEDAVGIPEEHSLMGDETYNAALEVEEKIKNGEIVPPANADEYAQFGK